MDLVLDAISLVLPLQLLDWQNRGSSVGSATTVQDDDTIGTLQFSGADGTNDIAGAFIRAQVDGTPGTDDMPSRLILATTADGASSPTERMRITSTGGIHFNNGELIEKQILLLVS